MEARNLLEKTNGNTAPRHRRRSLTLSMRRYSKQRLAIDALAYPPDPEMEATRPVHRGDCCAGGVNSARPCPWVSCRHHLYIDVDERRGSIKLNFPHLEVWELPETCALDVAGNGGMPLLDAGAMVNLTRERFRQIERVALLKLAEALECDLEDLTTEGTEKYDENA